jgi:hypothetical protein
MHASFARKSCLIAEYCSQKRQGRAHFAEGIEGCQPLGLLRQREPEASGWVPQADLLVIEGQPFLQQSNPCPLQDRERSACADALQIEKFGTGDRAYKSTMDMSAVNKQ